MIRFMKTIEIGLLSSLMANVTITDDCWLWTGDQNGSGYGSFNASVFRGSAHRVMFMIMNDEEPEVVRHTCCNPLCVKPTHLIPGTQQENMQDKFFDGTGNTQKLNPQQVLEIRARYSRTGHRTSNAGELAAEYGVTPKYIRLIGNGKRLNYVR